MTSNSSPPSRSVWWVLFFAGCATAACLVVFGLLPLRSPTYWWHVTIGDFIGGWGAIPDQQLFLYTVDPEQPWLYGSWLGAVALAVFDTLGGAELSVLVRNLAAAFSVGIVAWYVGRDCDGLLVPTVTVTTLIGLFALSVRTEPSVLTVPLATLAVVAAHRLYQRPDKVWAAVVLPASVLAVVNLDVAVAAAISLVALICAVHLLRRQHEGDNRRRTLAAGILAASALPAVVFGFAYGPGAWPQTLAAIVSWPETLLSARLIAPLVAGPLVLIALFRASPAALTVPRSPLVAATIGTAIVALFAPSTLFVFAVVAVLVVHCALTAQPIEKFGLPSTFRLLGIFVLLVAFAVVLQPGVDTRAPILTSLYGDLRTEPPHPGTISADLPLRCAEQLREAGGHRRVFHSSDHAGFLLYHLLDPEHPRGILFDDHRSLTDASLHERADLEATDAEDLFAEFDIEALVLDRREFPDTVEQLDDTARWYDLRAEGDEPFGCYIRTDPGPTTHEE